ncbi:hypothetical protein RB600_001804 [Gaeumannomyces tritici]
MMSSIQKAANKRAPMSCDRCKSRKTKCVDPVPGPCRYCQSLGVSCRVDPSRRRQRPYYHVSEEEFRLQRRALEHFLPNTEISLSSLRDLMNSLANRSPGINVEAADDPGRARSLQNASTDSPGSTELEETIEEIDDLHDEMGWLTVDSKGTYRHVGMEGGFGFNSAVRSLKHRRLSDTTSRSGSDLVTPLTAAPPCPPDAPDSSPSAAMGGHQPPRQVFLPRRDLCERCVGRFFRDVHSIYWLFSAEAFYGSLDRIYAGDSTCASASMLCSLYSILALTCESEARSDGISDNMANKYLSLAKALAPVLMDEADIDAIRALCLLGIALQSSMCSNTAYVYVGAAARIAFTLGLNVSKSLNLRSSFQGQIDLRIYCSLYLLDLDVALCYGNPPSLSDEDGAETLELVSEQILSPGTNMPLDFLSLSCKLAQLKRHISKLLYMRSGGGVGGAFKGDGQGSTGAGRPGARPAVPISSVSAALTSLSAWYESIPPHLRDVAQAAPYHKRSVAVLHLRYWSSVILATRPFLLYNVLHPEQARKAESSAPEASSSAGNSTTTESKRKFFEDFASTCLDAASKSLALLSYMRDAGILSSLVTFDTGCLLEDLQVFLLALAKSKGSKLSLEKDAVDAEEDLRQRQQQQTQAADSVRELLHILQGMEQIFWTRHALIEVMAQLDEHGLLNGERFSPGGDTPGLFCLDIPTHHDIVGEMMESYLHDVQDSFFGLDPQQPLDGAMETQLTFGH